jgi:hypothetical protein
MRLNPAVKDIFGFRYEDFTLAGYSRIRTLRRRWRCSAASPQIAMVLFAAVAENGVIGRENALPWRLSSDLKRFRAVTMGKPVVMGRKTYLSIGKPLSGRTNIVVSRSAEFAVPGVIVAGHLNAALGLRVAMRCGAARMPSSLSAALKSSRRQWTFPIGGMSLWYI